MKRFIEGIGRSQLTTAQVIEELVSRYPRKREVPKYRMGPRVK